MLSNQVEKALRKKNKKVFHVLPHDHTPQLKRLSRIKGQVEGVERMITDRRYCPEIVMQIKSIRLALKGLEITIVEGHMRHCVKEAIESGNATIVEEKIEEVLGMIKLQG